MLETAKGWDSLPTPEVAGVGEKQESGQDFPTHCREGRLGETQVWRVARRGVSSTRWVGPAHRSGAGAARDLLIQSFH